MKINFLTSSRKNCIRLEYRAIECGWFHNVYVFHDCEKSPDVLILERLKQMEDGDVLVYANEFSEINLNGRDVFYKNISMLNDCSIVMKPVGRIFESVLYIKKTRFSLNFFTGFNEFNAPFDEKEIKLVNPSLKCLQAETYTINAEFRLSEDDILPNCRKHYYERFAMFVAGHELPYYEIHYDMYTHFINVGNKDLQRIDTNSGINISEHQDLAELTALYWIWKNLNWKDLKYIGFSTYRKPFLMSNREMFEILEKKEYDCVANKIPFSFNKIHHDELGDEYVEKFKEILKGIMKPKEYKEFIKEYENYDSIYICNSFVMPVGRFDEFCKKVFRIMIPVAKAMRGMKGNGDHRPCSGCFAEQVSSFYLKKMFKKIYPAAFLIYPLYKRYMAHNLESPHPMIFGTHIEDGQEITYPEGVHHANNPDTAPEEIKSGFYSETDEIKREINITTSKSYIIDNES